MRAISLSCRKRVRARAICVSGGRGLRSSREKAWRVCWTVSAGDFFSQAAALQAHEPQGQQREGDVVEPAVPAPHFVMGQACLPLGLLEEPFDVLALGLDPHQFGQGRLRAGVGQGERKPRLRFDASRNQQGFFGAQSPFRARPDRSRPAREDGRG